MAQAMISGLSASKNRYQINIIENDQKILDKVKNHLPVRVIKSIDYTQTDIIILAVKPKDIKEVCKNYPGGRWAFENNLNIKFYDSAELPEKTADKQSRLKANDDTLT